MNGRGGHLGWAQCLLAGAAVLAAATAAARERPEGALAMATAPATALGDYGEDQRERVIEAVQRRFNARVVRVSETSVNGRPALELRLLSDQRVWNLVIDATTGQVLSGG